MIPSPSIGFQSARIQTSDEHIRTHVWFRRPVRGSGLALGARRQMPPYLPENSQQSDRVKHFL